MIKQFNVRMRYYKFLSVLRCYKGRHLVQVNNIFPNLTMCLFHPHGWFLLVLASESAPKRESLKGRVGLVSWIPNHTIYGQHSEGIKLMVGWLSLLMKKVLSVFLFHVVFVLFLLEVCITFWFFNLSTMSCGPQH